LASILFGIILSKLKNASAITDPLKFISKYIFKALHIVMLFAPIGAFGGMAFTIGKYGIATLIPLGKLMLTVYITMGVFVFVVLGLILRFYKISIFKFLNYYKRRVTNCIGNLFLRSSTSIFNGKIRKNGMC